MPEIPLIETEIVAVRRIRKNIAAKARIPKYRVKVVREGGMWVEDKNVSHPDNVYQIAKKIIGDADREQLYVMCLNQKNNVIGVSLISIGSLSASIVHPREIFKVAILLNSAAIIIFHNHPSGNTEPSPEDIQVTRKMQEAGDMIGIKLLDHMIIGYDAYLSIFQYYPEFQ